MQLVWIYCYETDRQRRSNMTKENVSMWKVEEFLVSNLKQIPTTNGGFKLEAECSIKDFLEKLEESINM